MEKSEILEKDVFTSTKDVSTSTKDVSTSTKESCDTPLSNTIKHIVIPGGGGTGLIAYGAIKESHKQGLWNINNVETIYGTSIGAIFAVVLSLKYDWQILDDYLIKRPWHQVFDFNMQSIINSFQKQGIFDMLLIEEMFSPLFRGVDLPLSVTMREFHEWSKIELHLYTTELNDFKSVDISHKTHPDWRVIDAVYASAALPLLFAPLLKDGRYYIDGGIFLNYPLYPCIQNGTNPDEILGIKRKEILSQRDFSEKSTLFDYILLIFNKTMASIVLNTPINNIQIKNQIEIECCSISMYELYMLTISQEERLQFIEKGTRFVTPKPCL
jgi:NTE family protein